MERYREYRDKNDNIIVIADGNNAASNVIEVVDPDCLLKVGDSVSDFSSNKDYLDDVYDGYFIDISNSRKSVKSNYYDVGSCSFCGTEGTDTVENFLKKYGFKDVEYSCDILDVDPLEEVCEECFKSWLPELNRRTYSEYNEFGVDTRTGLKINQSIKSSLTTAVNEAEDYFGTIAEDNTILCQDIVTEKDKIEMKKLAEKNNVNVKLGQYSVTFYEDSDYKDTWNTMLKKDVE